MPNKCKIDFETSMSSNQEMILSNCFALGNHKNDIQRHQLVLKMQMLHSAGARICKHEQILWCPCQSVFEPQHQLYSNINVSEKLQQICN